MKQRLHDVSVWLAGLYIFLALSVLGYILFFTPDTVMVIALIGMLSLVPVFFINTKYGILLLLIVRPIIDAFSFYSINIFDKLSLNLNALLAIFVCLWAITVWAREKIVWRNLVGAWWLFGFMLLALLSLTTSIAPTISISEWLRMLSIAVLFIIVQHVAQQDQRFVHWVIPAAGLSAIIPLLVGFYQLISQSGLSFGGLDNRIYGTFGHPNVLGFYLVMVLSVTIIKYLTTERSQRSLLYPIIIWSSLFALLFTYTRGAWLGLGVVLVVLGIMKYRKPLIMSAAVICFLIVFGQLINSVLIDSANINLNTNPLISRFAARSEEADSIDWRFVVLQTMLPQVAAQPWLGVGVGNFVTLRQLSDIGLFEDPEAHNDYLRLAIEVGLPGLLLYLGFLLSILVAAVRNYRSWPPTAWQKWYSLTLIGLVLAYLGMSAGDNLLQGTPVMWLFMTITGSLITLHPTQNNA